MADALALTLGHNSSAIRIRDGVILGGYEEERLSGIKSDSHYPKQAIERLLSEFPADYADLHICISHWFIDGTLPMDDTKHLDLDHLRSVANPQNWHYVDSAFTHHDAHMLSAMIFAGEEMCKNSYGLVIDGFGTMGECISVYMIMGSKRFRLLQRKFGFDRSLGLLYQYATSYMGMKEHQHEYKMLAYEPQFEGSSTMNRLIETYASRYIINLNESAPNSGADPMLNYGALVDVKAKIHKMLDDVVDQVFEGSTPSQHELRVAISYFVQAVVETVVLNLIRSFGISSIILAGGLFYNVKLNYLITKEVDKMCVMPLSGDQGAGLGVYEQTFGDLIWPDHLYWGNRDLEFSPGDPVTIVPEDMAVEIIANELRLVGFVNVIRGAMEFGPRALCNTTTLGVPHKQVTKVINEMNQRTNEMPMAPVLSTEQAGSIFADVDKVHKSLAYMITALEYLPNMHKDLGGVAHYYPIQDVYTGRPQIVTEESDPLIHELVSRFGPLINTSYNFHGQPIVFERESILKAILQQRAAIPDIDFRTIIITKEPV